MKLPYRFRPGAGFLIVASGLSVAMAFFAWGFATPPLETAWRLQVELMVGRRGPLRDDELVLLQGVLARDPALARSMLDGASAGLISANARGLVENGYAYVLRQSADAPAELEVTPAGLALDKPVTVQVRLASGIQKTAEATTAAPFATTLPGDGRFPQLVEVRVLGRKKANNKTKRPRPVSVRLRSST